MSRGLLRSFIVTLCVAGGLIACAPAIERDLSFFPMRLDAGYWQSLPAGTDDIRFDTDDSLALHGLLLHARQDPARGTILYFHGNGGNLGHTLPMAIHLQALGFNVLIWDYRGYGRSQLAPVSEAGLYRDGEAAFTTIAARLGIPRDQVILYGHSLGTAVATEMAVRHPCRALILEAPFASAWDQARATIPVLPWLLWPFTENRFETRDKIATAHCPLVVMHGDNDPMISVEQGKAVYAAARQPKRLMLVPGGNHFVWGEIDKALVLAESMTSQ